MFSMGGYAGKDYIKQFNALASLFQEFTAKPQSSGQRGPDYNLCSCPLTFNLVHRYCRISSEMNV